MKSLSRLFIFISITVGITQTTRAQQGFGTNSPAPSSVIDMVANSKSALLPRIALTATNIAAPVVTPADALTVFNTATAGVSPNNVTPGYYYWRSATSSWVRLLDQITYLEPWLVQGGSTLATNNAQNIYQTGKVSIGGSNGTATLTVLNAAGTANTNDFSMIANRASGNPATLQFYSNIGAGSFTSLSNTGDKGIIFSTDGDGAIYTKNGLILAPHVSGGGQTPFGLKITEQGFTALNIKDPTETFDVGGTVRLRFLPANGAANAVFTKADGSSSLIDGAAVTDLAKTQTFTASRTVVADANGVLGYVTGLPTASGNPWNVQNTTTTATTNAQAIYQAGNVSIGANAGNSTLSIAGSVSHNIRVITSSDALNATDYTLINRSSGPINLTLPDPTTCKGRMYYIVNNGAGNITTSRSFEVSGTNTQDFIPMAGLGYQVPFGNYGNRYLIQSDGAVWVLIQFG